MSDIKIIERIKMRLLFSGLIIASSFFSYSLTSLANEQTDAPAITAKTIEAPIQTPSPAVIEITINASNDGWDDGDITQDPESEPDPFEVEALLQEAIASLVAEPSVESEDLTAQASFAAQPDVETELPGKDVNFRFKLHTSGYFLIDGRATSDIGKILFKSKLMPTNEVKLSLTLKQRELDDIHLVAYFDLSNFTMELDGGKGALNKDHKKMLELTAAHLQPKLQIQYEGYDIPEHAMMLTQMLGYWSVSPEGFVHEKRSIVSE